MANNIDNDLEMIWRYYQGKKINDVYKNFDNIKSFIYNNPNDYRSINVSNWLLSELKKEFLNPKLLDAFNISDEKKYLKIFKIYEELPCKFHNYILADMYYKLINSPSEYYGNLPNFYKSCRWYFNKMNDSTIDDSIFDTLDKYCADNRILLKSSLNDYEEYEKELEKLNSAYNNNFNDEMKHEIESLDKELREKGYHSSNDTISAYTSKKLGIIGEYDTFDKIKGLNNSKFIAKDLGNGFGYDIFYTLENPYIERLVEVKTTLKSNGNDYFTLSDNEYNVLMDSLNRNNVEYIIARVFVDLKKDKDFDVKVLKFDPNDNSFISQNNEDGNIVKYKADYNKLLFKRNSLTLSLI